MIDSLSGPKGCVYSDRKGIHEMKQERIQEKKAEKAALKRFKEEAKRVSPLRFYKGALVLRLRGSRRSQRIKTVLGLS
ncbi:MAG: hypothetical protein K1060chlam2_01185 [Chlamydiae bacterium]|nr:hypothetical protein [Chlamydiota bacterium]